MIYLISGSTHSGKTYVSQQMLEKYHYSYISIDHLKMGLIRSHMIDVSVDNDDKLTEVLWPIISEMIKTMIENNQNCIIEGCYIPFNYQDSFEVEYLKNIKYLCLIMSEDYIKNHFDDIIEHENVIEKRLHHGTTLPFFLLWDNERYLDGCKKYNLPYIIVDGDYSKVDIK